MAIKTAERPPIRLPHGIYYGWMIVAVTFMVNLAASPMNAVVISFFLAPMSNDLGWDRSTLAWALTVRMVTGSIVATVLGPVVDKYGTRWLGVITGVVAGATVIGLYFVNGMWMLFSLFAVSGLAGFGGPGGALLTGVPVAKWFIAQRGRAMAISTAGMAVGTTIAVPVAAYLIQVFGWRWAWVVFGLVMWALILPFYGIFMRRDPEDVGLRPDGGPTLPGPARAFVPESQEVNWTLREATRTWVLWAIVLGQASAGFGASGLLLYRVGFWQEQGLAQPLVAIGIAMDPFVVTFTALLFGLLAERIAVRHIGVIGAVGWTASVLPMLLYVSGHQYFIFLHSVLWAIGSGAGINFQNLVWPNYFGRRSLGTIRGVLLPVSVAAGAIGGPMFGYIIDYLGYQVAFTIMTLLFLGPGIVYLFTRPPRLPADHA